MATTTKRGNAFKTALVEELFETVGGEMAVAFAALLPAEKKREIFDGLPESFTTDPAGRRGWARVVGAAAATAFALNTDKRGAIEEFIVKSGDELEKSRSGLDGKGGDKDRAEIRKAFHSHKGLLAPLKEGEKDQKDARPDYFTAKAVIKDEHQAQLKRVEQHLKTKGTEIYNRFMHRAGFKAKVTPEELTEIAKRSVGDLDYGTDRLIGLMDGPRGEAGIKARIGSMVSELIDGVTTGGDIGKNLKKIGKKAKSWAEEKAAKRAKRKAV